MIRENADPSAKKRSHSPYQLHFGWPKSPPRQYRSECLWLQAGRFKVTPVWREPRKSRSAAGLQMPATVTCPSTAKATDKNQQSQSQRLYTHIHPNKNCLKINCLHFARIIVIIRIFSIRKLYINRVMSLFASIRWGLVRISA